MTMSLYEALIPTWRQMLDSLSGVLDKGLSHAKSTGRDPDEFADARLIDDMFPLHLQVRRVRDHSVGALRDVQKGAFTRPIQKPCSYAEMQQMLAEARQELEEWDSHRVNALAEKSILFDAGSMRTEFRASAYLLSFAQPNFFFHAVTAYDILRSKGVPVGKRDYMGQPRVV